MGALIGDDDVLIPKLFALMNERFAFSDQTDSQGSKPRSDGIVELKQLDDTFSIFRPNKGADGDRLPTLRECAALLNLGGSMSWSLRSKWYAYLDRLDKKSTTKGADSSGGESIVAQLLDNLSQEIPIPVHFAPYEFDDNEEVIITDMKAGDAPLFFVPKSYAPAKYTMIQLPMKARPWPKK